MGISPSANPNGNGGGPGVGADPSLAAANLGSLFVNGQAPGGLGLNPMLVNPNYMNNNANNPFTPTEAAPTDAATVTGNSQFFGYN